MSTFQIGEHDFLLDGNPYRVLSGALHYFRVHPDQWADRIHKARLMGLNTIETYVAWNTHEPRRGAWDTSGGNDLGRFLDLVAAEGMNAIVRPGPYICAEWHNGGLPVWLTALPGIGLRSSEQRYLSEVSRYLQRVYELVAPRQIDRGGPVILVQIENEYGAYGADKAYLAELVSVTRAAGITVPLTTIDQPVPKMLRDGRLDGLHMTGSFGSRAIERLRTLREYQPTGPLMCAEFWDGWFDWWGGYHHTTNVADAAAELDTLLATGASVNLYMFHGGTNFGLTNGANDKGRYAPIVTSYDYDAPLDEAGNATEKYRAFREVLARYAPVPDENPPHADPATAFDVELELADSGWGELTSSVRTPSPASFEELDHISALVLYEADLDGRSGIFEIDEVRDRAWISVDGVRIGVLDRSRHERAISIPPGKRLSVLVEDQGRVNYERRLGERKGLEGTPRLDRKPFKGWLSTPIDVMTVAAAALSMPGSPVTGPVSGPVTLRGQFEIDDPMDLFLSTKPFGKGFAVINGFLLGRYWRNGPQRTLYVPAPVLRAGVNTIIILELEHTTTARVTFQGYPDLGHIDE